MGRIHAYVVVSGGGWCQCSNWRGVAACRERCLIQQKKLFNRAYCLPGCLPGCVLSTLNGATLWDWAITTDPSKSLSLFHNTSIVFPWKLQRSLPIPPPHPAYSNGWQPSVRRRTFWCLFEIFFSLTWVNAPWFFLKCPVQKMIRTIWQTILLISWTTLI